MEGDWPQLEGLLTRRGGCTYLSHGTSEFRASACFMMVAHWFLAPHPICSCCSILFLCVVVCDVGWSVSCTELVLDCFLKHQEDRLVPSASRHTDLLLQLGKRPQEWGLQRGQMLCRRARLNGSDYSLIPPCVTIPEGFTTYRSRDWWRAPCWKSPFVALSDPPHFST